jgi:hypothetical protein
MALDIAAQIRAVTHIARLDDDDTWLPHHLSTLCDAYQLHPEAGFAHTQAEGVIEGLYPPHTAGTQLQKQAPRPCTFAPATTSWDIRQAAGQLRFRQQDEQLASTRAMRSCCEDHYYPGRELCPTVMAVDADMWERMWSLVQSEQLVALFIPKVTVTYTNSIRKKQLLDAITSGTCNSKCALC